jgi:hypothetical protein
MPNTYVNRVLFNDGEGVDYNDFDNAQAYAQAFLLDLLHRQLGDAYELGTVHLASIAANNAAVWAPNAQSAAPVPDAGILSIKNTAGLVMVTDATAVDGLTPRVRSYYLDDGEIALDAADLPADATNPRFAAIYIKIDQLDTGSESRDFDLDAGRTRDAGGDARRAGADLRRRVATVVPRPYPGGLLERVRAGPHRRRAVHAQAARAVRPRLALPRLRRRNEVADPVRDRRHASASGERDGQDQMRDPGPSRRAPSRRAVALHLRCKRDRRYS